MEDYREISGFLFGHLHLTLRAFNTEDKSVPARPPVAAEMPKKPSLGMIMLSTFVQNS